MKSRQGDSDSQLTRGWRWCVWAGVLIAAALLPAACGKTNLPAGDAALPGVDATATAARAVIDAALAASPAPAALEAPPGAPDLAATATAVTAALQTAQAATLAAQPTATATDTPSATATPSPTPTASPSATPTPSATTVPTATPTATPSPSVTPSPTATPAPTDTPDAAETAAALETQVARRIAQGIAATQTAAAHLQPTATPTHTPTRVATATPSATPTPTPTRAPTRTPSRTPTPARGADAPAGEWTGTVISAARLNLRAAPSAAAAILGTLDRGATVDILYRNDANDWWYVCCIAGTDTSGWVSNRFLRSSLDLATARTALSVLASDEVAPPASTRAASSQVAAALAQESAPAGGPAQLVATSAARGRDATYLVGERENFSWQTDAPLLPGQVFEVVFFGENEGPEAGRATAPASADASAAVPVPAAGRYAWGVWLANAQPYQRLRYLGTGGWIVVTEPGEPREPEPPFDVPQPESPLY